VFGKNRVVGKVNKRVSMTHGRNKIWAAVTVVGRGEGSLRALRRFRTCWRFRTDRCMLRVGV
jgi:hypothetical protein